MSTTVLLLHGTGASSSMWAPYAAAWSPLHRVVAPDLTGAGANPPIPHGTPVDVEDDVAIALAAVDAAPGKVDVVGHSYGGWLAARVGLARPDKVRQVIAHDPVLWGVLDASDDDEVVVPFRAMVEGTPLLDPAVAGTEAWWQGFLGFWRGEGSWERLPEAHKAMCLRVGWKAFHEVKAGLVDGRTVETWAELACPLRITLGETSPAPVREVAFTLLEHLREVEVHEVPGGHLAPITNVEDCLALWSEWLVG